MKKLALLAVLLLAAGCSGNVKKSPADALRRDPYEFLAERLSEARDGAQGRKVAVLPFAYTDRRESDDGVVISERLLTRIIQEGRLQVVERSLLAKVMGELKLQNSGVMDAASIKSLGRVLGVDAVVTGTLTRHGDGSVEINARMIKAETAVVLTAAAATVPADWEASAPQPAQVPAPAVQPQAAPQAALPAAPPFPGAWRYRENFRVAEKSGAPLTDYPVLVKFDSAAAIRLGRMKADCSDVRFANSDERTAFPFWLEGGCGTAETRAWVRLPVLAKNSVKNIYLYYGNAAAAAASSGEGTFRFFDDFSVGGVDRTKWTEIPGDCRVYVRGGRLEFQACSSGNATRTVWVRTNMSFQPPYVVDFDAYSQDAGPNGLFHILGLRWDGGVTGGYNTSLNGAQVTFHDGCSVSEYGRPGSFCGKAEILSFADGVGRTMALSSQVLTPATEHRYSVSDDSRSISVYLDGRLLTTSEVLSAPGAFLGLTMREYPRNYTGYFDNFRVRPYSPAEPEVTLFRGSAL